MLFVVTVFVHTTYEGAVNLDRQECVSYKSVKKLMLYCYYNYCRYISSVL